MSRRRIIARAWPYLETGGAFAAPAESRNAQAVSLVYLPVTSSHEWSQTMTVAEFETLSEQEAADVLEWRFSQLTRSGFAARDAIRLATRLDVDLHRAADLLVRGCPPDLALRILL